MVVTAVSDQNARIDAKTTPLAGEALNVDLELFEVVSSLRFTIYSPDTLRQPSF
jgi:FKBP-type peptidyl-prolyl cis-trans isomerase 2